VSIVRASFTATASVDKGRRRIVGLVVPFGQQGTAALDGEPAKLTFEAGSLTYDDANSIPLVIDHTGSKPVFAGRARDLVATAEGIVGTFKVIAGPNGDQALAEAEEGLRTGLSVEAELDNVTRSDDGTYTVTAANPGILRRVALVETPAFTAARISEVAAAQPKEATMSDAKVTAAEVPDDVLSGVITNLTEAVSQLNQSLAMPAGDPNAPAPAAASGTLRPNLTAAGHPLDGVKREPFPYGYEGAEGRSFFHDITAASEGHTEAGARVRKASTMMAELAASKGPRGKNLLTAGDVPEGIKAQVTAANEPTVRSTLLIPNTYDLAHYAAQLKFPRVIADQVPGVAIADPRPQVIPTFTSSFADGGSGEPVIASTEGTNPAQAELAVGSATVTPIWYHGLFDVARQALDAGGPATDEIVMAGLRESYAQVTEGAAVTAILANGTTGTDVTTNADTIDIEPRSALKAIRTQLGTFFANRGMPADAVLYAPDVYQVAVGADTGTAGEPLYKFLSDRGYQAFNAAGDVNTGAMALNVYGVPGLLAFKLTATKFVMVKWADVIRYESPTYEFRLMEPVAPASVRFAIGGYFAQRTLQAKGVRYFSQL
jgi:phage head maturation protease